MSFKSNQQCLFQFSVTGKNMIYLCISCLLLEGCGCDRTCPLSQLLSTAAHCSLAPCTACCLFHQFRNVLPNIKHAVNTHLWDNPVFPAGSLCFSHALGPGSDISWTVVSITLEHKLPLALLAGQQSSKCHPICYSVQDLKQQRTQSSS